MKFIFFILFGSSSFLLLYFTPKKDTIVSFDMSNVTQHIQHYEKLREQYAHFSSIQKCSFWQNRLLNVEQFTSVNPSQKLLCTQIANTLTPSFFEYPSKFTVISELLSKKLILYLGKEKTAYLCASVANNEDEYELLKLNYQQNPAKKTQVLTSDSISNPNNNSHPSEKQKKDKKDSLIKIKKPTVGIKSYGYGYKSEDDIGISNCSCSTKSDFCSGVFTCTASDCTTSNNGCGFFFMYACNGICTR